MIRERVCVNDYEEKRYNKINKTNFAPSLTALRCRYTAAFEEFCWERRGEVQVFEGRVGSEDYRLLSS